MENPIERKKEEKFRRGVELFNRGDYHEGHEFWEDIWREEPHPARLFYQGLIQVCAGLLHLEWGHRRGCRNHAERALDKLRQFPADHHGIALGDLITQVDGILSEATVDRYLGRKLEPQERPQILAVESTNA